MSRTIVDATPLHLQSTNPKLRTILDTGLALEATSHLSRRYEKFKQAFARIKERDARPILNELVDILRTDISPFEIVLIKITRAKLFLASKLYADCFKDAQEALKQCKEEYKNNNMMCMLYLVRGQALFGMRKYEKSTKDFDKCIMLVENFFPGYYNKGILLDKIEKYEEAISVYGEGIKINEKHGGIRTLRGITYQKMKQQKKAYENFCEAIKISTTLPLAYYSRGGILAKRERYKAAIRDFDKAIELNQQFCKAYSLRGSCYSHIGNYEKAIQDYTVTISLKPKSFLYYFNRGTTYDKAGKSDLAMLDFNKCLNTTKNEDSKSKSYLFRGIIQRKAKKYIPAIVDFNRCLKIEPENALALFNRGICYCENSLKQTKRGINDLTKAIKLDQKNISVIIYRAKTYKTIYMSTKNESYLVRSKKDFSLAISLNPKDPNSYSQRASLYKAIKNYPRAIKDFTKSMSLQPHSHIIYFNRATVYALMRDYEKAIIDLSKVIELEDSFADAYFHRGRMYLKSCQNRKARVDFQKCVKLNPKYKDKIRWNML